MKLSLVWDFVRSTCQAAYKVDFESYLVFELGLVEGEVVVRDKISLVNELKESGVELRFERSCDDPLEVP